MKENLVKDARELIQDRIAQLKSRMQTLELRERQLRTLPSAIKTEEKNLKELKKDEEEAKANSVSDEELLKLNTALKEAEKKDKKEAEKAVAEAIAKRGAYRKAVAKREECAKLIEEYKTELADIKEKIAEERVEYKRLPNYIEEAEKCLSILKTEVTFKDKLTVMKKDCIKQRKSKGWVDNCTGCPHWSEKFKECSAEALFKGNPSHYDVAGIEETLNRNYVEHCERK